MSFLPLPGVRAGLRSRRAASWPAKLPGLSTAGALLCLGVPLVCLALLAVPPVSSTATERTSALYYAADTCYAHGSYVSGCCCSPRDKLPVTKSVWKATKTVTKTHTATGKNKSAKRFVANDEPVALDQSPDEAAEEQSEHELFARHLCSVCPASVKLSKGKNNGGSAAVYCCPRRRTVTKTRAQTKTILKTKTVTAKPKATIQGTLFYDNNKNGVYDAGDELIRNTRVLLIIPTKKQPVRRAVGSVLSKTLTDNQGGFKIIFDAQRPNITLQIVKDVAPNDPLLEFKTNAEGGADVDVPILRPAEKPFVANATVSKNIATITGTGVPGRRIVLYVAGVRQSTIATVAGDGTFTIKSGFLGSGDYPLTVSQMDSKGAESETTTAGTASILPPPTVNNKPVAASRVTVNGKAEPGALVKIYADGNLVGSGLAAIDGSFSILSDKLFSGSLNVTLTQEDDAGVSDLGLGGLITVPVPAPGSLIWDSTTLSAGSAKTAVVTGTGAAGATIKIYEGSTVVGTGVVSNAGTWTVTTSTLTSGKHTLEASQTPSGSSESAKIPAGSVEIPWPFSWTSTALSSPGANTAVVLGAGTPGASIKVYEGSSVIGTATVGQEGTWSVTSSALSVGTHAFSATETAPSSSVESAAISAGSVTVSESAQTTVAVKTTVAGAATTKAVVTTAATGNPQQTTQPAGVTTKQLTTTVIQQGTTTMVSTTATETATTSTLTPSTTSATTTCTDPPPGADKFPLVAMGNGGWNNAAGVTVDSQENVYMGGYVSSAYGADRPDIIYQGLNMSDKGAGFALFVAKFSPSGSAIWVWTNDNAGSNPYPCSVSTVRNGPDGHLWLVGAFQKDLVSTGMTTGPASDGAGYLLKLHKDTGAAIKNYRFAAEVAGITFDSADGLYVSGVYGGSGSGPAPGGLSFPSNKGMKDVFVAKYNDSSDTWIWAVGFGTTSADKTELIDPVATSRGTVLVALQTTGGNVYMDTTVVLTANNGDTVQAIVELDAATGELVQYVRIVTSSSDLLSAGLVEAGNNFYFAGYHQATLTTSNGLSIPFGSGFQDNTYLLRLNSSTLLPEIVTTMRGSSAVNIRTLRVASTSPLTFAAGGTNHARPLTIQTPNGDETWVTTQDPSNARDSAVTFILNSDLLVIHKAVLGRAIKGDAGQELAVGNSGDIYLTGIFTDNTYIACKTNWTATNYDNGAQDLFLMKYNAQLEPSF